MAANTSLFMLHIFEEYSDANHPLSKKKIIDLLFSEFGIDISDKQFYRKINELEEAYYNVVKTRGKYAKYYLNKNTLDSYELLYIYSLIKSSKFISKDETNKLIDGLDNISPVPNKMDEFYRKCLSNIDMDKVLIDNIKKFRVIIDAIKNKYSIRYKIMDKEKVNEVTFSDYLFMWPKSYKVVEGNFFIIAMDSNKQKKEISLNDMFNVEIKEF